MQKEEKLEKLDTNGIYMSTGKQGNGKTLLLMYLLANELKENPNRKVFSNIWLSVPYTPVTFDNNIGSEDSIDILEKLQNDPKFFNNSIMILDEIHIYADSYNFTSKNNKILQAFMTQLRKRNILILASTQYFSQVDSRVRKQTKYIFQMYKLNRTKFKADIMIPDGYYQDYIKTVFFDDLSPYFKLYDTNEVVS